MNFGMGSKFASSRRTAAPCLPSPSDDSRSPSFSSSYVRSSGSAITASRFSIAALSCPKACGALSKKAAAPSEPR